jgi:hypothetical protein
MSATYKDRLITIDDAGIQIRAYYFPWGGTKRITYEKLRSVQRVTLGLVSGRGRIWGSANPFRVWASLDVGRPRKKVGFMVDSGRRISALMTPDDPDAAEQALRAHVDDGVFPQGSRRAPIV